MAETTKLDHLLSRRKKALQAFISVRKHLKDISHQGKHEEASHTIIYFHVHFMLL